MARSHFDRHRLQDFFAFPESAIAPDLDTFYSQYYADSLAASTESMPLFQESQDSPLSTNSIVPDAELSMDEAQLDALMYNFNRMHGNHEDLLPDAAWL